MRSKLRVKYLFNFALFLCVYLFIFSPRLNFGFSVHTGYLVVFLVFALGLSNLPKALSNRSIVIVLICCLFMMAYHLFMASLYFNNPVFFTSILTSLVIYLVFGFVLSDLVSDDGISIGLSGKLLIDKIVILSALAIFVNSLIILIEYLSPELKSIIESILVNDPGANIDYAEHTFRLRGFSSAGGAALSVVNALAVLFFMYLMINNQVSCISALVCSLLIVVSNIFTGRTGLLFGILFFLILLLFTIGQLVLSGWNGRIRALGLIFLLGILIIYLFRFHLDPAAAGWAFEWVDGLENGKIDSASVDELNSMLFIPDNPIHLLFGIGFFEGNNNLYPRSDSGYLKTIFAIGVPLGVLLYSIIIYLFAQLRVISYKYGWLVWSVLAFMLFVEIKEPFIYQNFSARVVLLLSGAALFILSRRPKC